jgi:release factor glutamine methyltransferase
LERISLVQTDLLAGIQADFDLICANLPYIPSEKLTNLEVVRHEPRLALDGGPQGLDAIACLLNKLKVA